MQSDDFDKARHQFVKKKEQKDAASVTTEFKVAGFWFLTPCMKVFFRNYVTYVSNRCIMF